MGPLVEHVLATGKAVLGENLSMTPDRGGPRDKAYFTFCYSALRREDGEVAGVFITAIETTARVEAEADRDESARRLREDEDRQAFLLGLNDRIGGLTDPGAIMNAAAETTGRHLGAGRCGYGEADETGEFFTVERDWTDGRMESMTGRIRLNDFGRDIVRDYQAGKTVRLDDSLADSRTEGTAETYAAAGGTRAGIGVPLVKEGRFVAAFYVHQTEPRRWTNAEVALAENVAERTWAAVERARSEATLRESEERFRQFAENSADVLWIVHADHGQLEYLSPVFEKVWGEPRERVLADIGRWAELVHPDDRDRAAGAMPRLLAGETITQTYRIVRHADGATRWILDTGFPIRDKAGRIRRVAGVAQDMTDRILIEKEVRESRRRWRALVEGIPQLVWRAVDPGEWSWASPQWTDFTGQIEADSRGWGWLDTVHPDDRDAARLAWSRAPEQGGLEVDYRIRCDADGRYRWFQTRAAPVRSEQGEIVEWLGTSTDIDDIRTLQEEQKVLVSELQHRTRNLLAVVQAIASQTLARSDSLETFGPRFTDRLGALSRVQGLLSRSGQREITIDQLVRMELDAMGADAMRGRLTVEGPPAPLHTTAVQTLALAIHELATNARKHGAMATDTGRLSVTWRLRRAAGDGEDGGSTRLALEWVEEGATPRPDRKATGRRSYGRDLIERALPYSLGAETSFELNETGVRCRIDLPLPDHVETKPALAGIAAN